MVSISQKSDAHRTEIIWCWWPLCITFSWYISTTLSPNILFSVYIFTTMYVSLITWVQYQTFLFGWLFVDFVNNIMFQRKFTIPSLVKMLPFSLELSIIIIIIIIISSIKNIEHLLSLFFAPLFYRYSFVRKKMYTLLTSLKYFSTWYGGMPVKAGQCLSGCYIRAILQ